MLFHKKNYIFLCLGKYAGGNSACVRPTPDWQKGIGLFLTKKPVDKENTVPETEDQNMERYIFYNNNL